MTRYIIVWTIAYVLMIIGIIILGGLTWGLMIYGVVYQHYWLIILGISFWIILFFLERKIKLEKYFN